MTAKEVAHWVKEHIKDSRIKLLFIPAFSPNLNLIEWLWKFCKKQIFIISIILVLEWMLVAIFSKILTGVLCNCDLC
ncbi:transposase [Thiospirillum jenense]|uniref:Transposase n=1 Tax=Thiospirillum jenense TaxID=1653858 RepID=A0A839HEW3_9GAMM|nr:transposase [Thiospirillum jenense]